MSPKPASAAPRAEVVPIESLHDRKVRLVRRQLAEIALGTILERGFDAVTIDEIATAAGISRRSFFRYFATKEEVVTGAFDDAGEALFAAFATRPRSESPLEALRASLQPIFAAFESQPVRMRRTMRLIRETPALRGHYLVKQDDWADQLAIAIRARLPKSAGAPLLAQVTARVGVAAIDAAMMAWIERDDGDLASIADAAFEAIDVAQTSAAPVRRKRGGSTINEEKVTR